MPAAVAAAEAPAAMVLLGKNQVALGRIVKIAGLQRLGSKGGKARVGGWGHKWGGFQRNRSSGRACRGVENASERPVNCRFC